jgi:allophanate hydrolase subunit 2
MTANELGKDDYIISNESNRMGIRTVGKKMQIDDGGSMISKPIYPGMVQCPQNGLPIILGSDAQTLGGYPRILQVIKADRHLLGQLKPNDRFRFNLISIAEAIDEWNTLKKAYPFICEL